MLSAIFLGWTEEAFFIAKKPLCGGDCAFRTIFLFVFADCKIRGDKAGKAKN